MCSKGARKTKGPKMHLWQRLRWQRLCKWGCHHMLCRMQMHMSARRTLPGLGCWLHDTQAITPIL